MFRWHREGDDIILSVDDFGLEEYRAEVGRARKQARGWAFASGNNHFTRTCSASSAVCALGAFAGLAFNDMLEAFEIINEIENEESANERTA